MRIPPEVKPALWGAAGGAIVWWAVLAFGFGWTSAGTTLEIATAQAEKAVVAALGPICAEKFNAQTDAAANGWRSTTPALGRGVRSLPKNG